jgi:hypothetical protein
MRRIIHRSAKAVASSSSDEDNEDDAFTALSKKQKKVPGKSSTNDDSSGITNKNGDTTATGVATAADTCSNKRHFHMSSERAAKMDALLKELEYDASLETTDSTNTTASAVTSSDHFYNDGFVPNKKGSFVEAGEEYSTTNIFVGNLDPSVTEEMLTDLFRQFGEETKKHESYARSFFVCSYIMRPLMSLSI